MHLISLFIPLVTSIYIGIFGRFIGKTGGFLLAITGILISWFSSILWFNSWKFISFGLWFIIGNLHVFWTFNFSSISWIMFFVVTTVAPVVYFFSYYYLNNDPHLVRFFMYLLLFTFFMLFFIVSDSLFLIFWGWEGVGICSYLLISFWYTRINAIKASLKAVFINKISDLFVFCGMLLVVNELHTTELSVIYTIIPYIKEKIIYFLGLPLNLLNLVASCFFIGVIGKSSQIGLHTWLAEAMEGPTPVSALIHAATMVTAGVFLIIKFSILFEYAPKVLKYIIFFGCITALLASIMGSFQNDIKKIIAYSTCSQLGYMVVSCGLSNYNLGLYHLFNHAFFKALLFLSSGLLIAFYGNQDIRKFNVHRYKSPLLHLCFLIPILALCGFPFFSGAFSKELIIQLSKLTIMINGNFIYNTLLFSACLTTFYSFKLLYIIFHKKTKFKYFYHMHWDNLNMNVVHIVKWPRGSRKYRQDGPNYWLRYRRPMIRIRIKRSSPSINLDSYVYYPLIILMLLSITSGYFFSDIFLGIGSDFFSKDIFINPIQKQIFFEKHFEIFSLKTTPFLCSIFFYYTFNKFNTLIKKNKSIFYMFKLKLYFDYFINFITYFLYKGSYILYFKNIDKGFLEIFGAFGIIRFFYFITFNLNKYNSGLLFNYICIFSFFFFLILLV